MQEDEDLRVIRDEVVRFRHAIDRARRDDWKGNMKRFPEECCHHGCSLLLLFFKQIGVNGFCEFSGRHPCRDDGTHVWLQKGQIVVDITADQFPGINEKVTVSRKSFWHEALRGRPESSPTNPNFDDEISEWYVDTYQDILANLSKDEMPSAGLHYDDAT